MPVAATSLSTKAVTLIRSRRRRTGGQSNLRERTVHESEQVVKLRPNTAPVLPVHGTDSALQGVKGQAIAPLRRFRSS